MSENITVKLIKSRHGRKPKQAKTLEALGLKRIRQVRILPDNPAVRGMLRKVSHLVEVKE